MLRFAKPSDERRSYPLKRERRRLWILFAMACLVIFLMRMLREPETATRIDSLFTPAQQAEDLPPSIQSVLAAEAGDVTIRPVDSGDAQATEPVDKAAPSDGRFDLSAVEDNTYFLPTEAAAWFEVLGWLQTVEVDHLKEQSWGNVTYTQLIEQPDVYRGNVVTVDGTVRRCELLDAPPNELGIDQYYRLVLRPDGGGLWPIVTYCLTLPEGFPTGDDIREAASVTGVFFKNWSYSWESGLGLAPVILARDPQWRLAVTTPARRRDISLAGTVVAVAVAAIAAMVFGWLSWRNTRRPASMVGGETVVIGPPAESHGEPL